MRILSDLDLRGRFSFDALDRISRKRSQDRRPQMLQLLLDLDRMCHTVGLELRKICHSDDIQRFHDEMVEAVNEEDVAYLSLGFDLKFPLPPLPGTDAIRPISDIESLREEGAVQKHCALAYGHEIAVKEAIYIYRVLEPERATLSVRRYGGRWHLGELKGFKNREVSFQTRAMVRKWFESAMGQHPIVKSK